VNVSLDDAPDASALLERTTALCRRCKEAGLSVTQGRQIDVFRSLHSIDWLNEQDFRTALRANLAGSRDEELIFDRVFGAYWRGAEDDGGHRSGMRPELVRGDIDYGMRQGHKELRTDPEHFSAEQVIRDLNLLARWDPDAPSVDQIIRVLAKRLATRPSRRTRHSPRGRRVDIRRSVRRNVRHGMDLIELSKVRRRTRKTRIVMLCDVSGSMDAFNPFLLQMMLGLQQQLKNSRTLVFSTEVTEITSLLRRETVEETLSDIGEAVRHWSGGTDIGAAIAALNRGALREGSPRSTVAVIISDGYDNGDIETIKREMTALRRRVRTVVWINPMYGSTTFKVRAAGMTAALPFIDHLLPAFNAKSLRTLVRELAHI
jgi:uncharacterized protein with von Willebrand factor type A (vWA) domain